MKFVHNSIMVRWNRIYVSNVYSVYYPLHGMWIQSNVTLTGKTNRQKGNL